MNEKPTHVDLFSGIGGFALAAKWAGFRTIAFCEIDKYCQKVLAKNFGALANPDGGGREGHELQQAGVSQPASKVLAKNFLANTESEQDRRIQQPRVPTNSGSNGGTREVLQRDNRAKIISNIFDLDGTDYQGCALLTGGFPCQPFSVAGKRRGAADDRAIWPEMFRVIKEARPAWVLGENVPGIIQMELDNVLSDMESIGYACRPFVIPACAVDARHRRDRLWIVGRNMANPDKGGIRRAGTSWDERHASQFSKSVADSPAPRLSESGLESGKQETDAKLGTEHCCRWLPEPDVGGTFDGLSRWLDGFGGLNGATSIEFADEAVCPLWDRVLAQEIREPACVSPEKILLAVVCKLKKWNVDEAWIQLAGKEALEAKLRGVRYDEAASCPSCRSGYSQQHAREHPDFVQVVSRLLARYAEKAWIEYRWSDACPSLGWETGFARVAHGVQKQVDRLKGLGNSIVPQVAYEILRVIYDERKQPF